MFETEFVKGETMVWAIKSFCQGLGELALMLMPQIDRPGQHMLGFHWGPVWVDVVWDVYFWFQLLWKTRRSFWTFRVQVYPPAGSRWLRLCEEETGRTCGPIGGGGG
jgi:hypothetical protein